MVKSTTTAAPASASVSSADGYLHRLAGVTRIDRGAEIEVVGRCDGGAHLSPHPSAGADHPHVHLRTHLTRHADDRTGPATG